MTQNRREVRQHCSNSLLHSFSLPVAAAEYQRTDHREGRKRDRYRPEHATRTECQPHAEHVAKWDFPKPEDKQVDDCRRPCVAGTVERLPKNHAAGVKQKTIRHDAKTIDTVLRDVRLVGVEPDDLRRKEYEYEADDSKEDHVVKPGLPNSAFCARRILRSQRLTDHRRCRIGHSPRRQEPEKDHANPDRIARRGIAAETRDDRHYPDPARHADKNLKGSGS